MEELKDITWFGHASFLFHDAQSGNKIYYVDPFELRGGSFERGDLIFITHAHPDHFSLQDLQKVLKEESVVIATKDVLALSGLSSSQTHPVVPNENYTLKGFSFQTIPAYNTKGERLSFHPKENNWVGYIFHLNEKKIYHAGDTDFIPEMQKLKALALDVALLPIGGTYTMDAEEASNAANAISAKFTVPMHYKKLLGEDSKKAEELFKTKVTSSQVVILDEVS